MNFTSHNIVLLFIVLLIAGVIVGFIERFPGIDANFAMGIKILACLLALLYVLRFFGLF